MRKLWTLLIVLSAHFCYAQQIPITIQKGEIFQDGYKESTIVLSENAGNGLFLTVRSYLGSGLSSDNGFYIEYRDANLKLQKKFEFEMKHPNYQKYNVVIGVFSIKDNIQIVEIYYDLNDKAFICQAHIITQDFKTSKKELCRFTKEQAKEFGSFNLQDKCFARTEEPWTNNNTGEIYSEDETNDWKFFKHYWKGFKDLNDDLKNIGSPEGQSYSGSIKTKIYKRFNGSDIALVVNETKTAFAIVIDFNNDKKQCLKAYSFDADSNLMIDTVFTRAIRDKKYIVQSFQLSPDGKSIYLVGKEYKPELKEKKLGGKYVFEVTQITAKDQKAAEIDTGENFIGSLRTIFHDNQLVCLGFYSTLQDYKMQGIAYFKIDPEKMSVEQTKYSLFTQQFLEDKYGKNSDKALKMLAFKSAMFTKSNDLIFIAQEEYEVASNNGGMAAIQVGQTSTLYFDDIICAKLNPSGDLLWVRNINKAQSYRKDDGFLSFTAAVKENTCYLFLNAKEEVKKLRNDRIEFRGIRSNKSNLNVIRLNPDGDFDYSEILDDKENEVPFMVSRGAVTDDGVYFLGRKGKDKQFLKISL